MALREKTRAAGAPAVGNRHRFGRVSTSRPAQTAAIQAASVAGRFYGPLTPTGASGLVRVLLAGDGRASALDLRRLIAGHPDLVAVGQAVAVHETLQQVQELKPDVVVLDRTLAHDVVLFARELASLDRPPAVVIRSAPPEPLMKIAAIVAGVRGIVNRSDPQAAFCDALRWVAANGRWLPDIAPVAVSRAGSRLKRDDLPILLMLLRGTPWSEIAADLGITAASVDARRSEMLRDVLGELPAASARRGWAAGESAAAVDEADPRIALAA